MCINAQNNELQYEVFLIINIIGRLKMYVKFNVTFLHLLHRVFNVTTKKWELKYLVDNADTLFTINLSQE